MMITDQKKQQPGDNETGTSRNAASRFYPLSRQQEGSNQQGAESQVLAPVVVSFDQNNGGNEMEFVEKIENFRQVLSEGQRVRILRDFPNWSMTIPEAKVHYGKKYVRVDYDGSGKYMVEVSTGAIYGIKAYGVIHRGHYYGTLDTLDQYRWDAYTAFKKPVAVNS